jgi:phosphoglycolate phosphatase
VSVRRLVMWDIDLTLLHSGGIGGLAFAHAFEAVTGRAPEWLPRFGGRTDLWLTAEVFARHELPDPDVPTFFDLFAAAMAERADLLRERGRVLPGAREVLAGLSRYADVVQTPVTGNIVANAHLKLTAFDLAGLLDLTVGGYGDEHTDRAGMVAASRARAQQRYGELAEVIVVGDTVHDVAGALAVGATAIGVASGRTGADELRAAGAHVVLGSLADVRAVVALLSGTSGT